MAMIPCRVTAGLRPQEATVEVTDFHGQKEYLPVDRAFLFREGDSDYLPVRLVLIEEKQKAALVALPLEADSGAHQIWVKLSAVKEPARATA
jgi:hypothetical protein